MLGNASETDTAYDLTSAVVFEALRQAGSGALVADNEGTIIYVNPRMCEITGYTEEELLGKNPRVLQSGSTPRETYFMMWNTISSGRSWHGILQNRKKNGDLYWEAITISPIKSSLGEITHYSAIFDDITSVKLEESVQAQVEEEMVQAEKQESLRALTFGIAHQLNNGFSSVLAACDLVKKQLMNPEQVLELIELIQRASRQSADFVRQMTELLKPNLSSAFSLDLGKTIEAHLLHYKKIAGSAALSLNQISPDVRIAGNPGLIHEAILALLQNAVEGEPSKPIELSCGVLPRLEPQADEYFMPCGLASLSVAYIEVKDSGPGMDSFVSRRACNPFYTTKNGHKGLGLAIVHGIVAAHKGAIGIISSPGKGTRVRLYFRASSAIEKQV